MLFFRWKKDAQKCRHKSDIIRLLWFAGDANILKIFLEHHGKAIVFLHQAIEDLHEDLNMRKKKRTQVRFWGCALLFCFSSTLSSMSHLRLSLLIGLFAIYLYRFSSTDHTFSETMPSKICLDKQYLILPFDRSQPLIHTHRGDSSQTHRHVTV